MGENIRVLIIDDHELIREAIKDCMAGLSCSFIEAQNEQEALNEISVGKFDIIFLDLGLPEADGLETLKKAKQMRPNLAPVVVLTAYHDDGRRRNAEELGILDYLTKDNLSVKEVTRVIAMALKS